MANILVTLGLQARGFLGQINTAVGGLRKLGSTMSKTAKFTTGLGIAIGAIAAIHIRNSIKEFIKFEVQLAGLAKVMNDFDAAETIARNIGQLSKVMPVASAEMFKVAETAARLGIRGVGNLREFTRVATMMGAATDLSADQAADAFARILKQTRTPIKQFETLGSVINELSNNMATTTSEIVDSVRRSAPELARLGFTANEISALAASLNEVSESASRAGTRLRRLAQDLGDPRKVGAFAEAIGEKPIAFRQLLKENPVQTLQRIIAVFGAGGAAADKLAISLDTRVRLALAALSQNAEGTARALEIMKEQIAGPDSLQTEFDIFADTVSGRMQMVQNSIDELQRQTGRKVIFMKEKWVELKFSILDALTSINKFQLFSNDIDALDRFQDKLRETIRLRLELHRDPTQATGGKGGVTGAPTSGRFRAARAEAIAREIEEQLLAGLEGLGRGEQHALEIITNVLPDVLFQNGVEAAKIFGQDVLDVFQSISDATDAGILPPKKLDNFVKQFVEASRQLDGSAVQLNLFMKAMLDINRGVPFEQAAEALRKISEQTLNTFNEELENKKILLEAQLNELRLGPIAAFRESAKAIFGDFDDPALNIAVPDIVTEIEDSMKAIAFLQKKISQTEDDSKGIENTKEKNKQLEKQIILASIIDTHLREQREFDLDIAALEREIVELSARRGDEGVEELISLRERTIELLKQLQTTEALAQIEEDRLKAIEKRNKEEERIAKRLQDRMDELGLKTAQSRFEFLIRTLENVGEAATDAFEKIITGSDGAGRAILDMIGDIARELLKRQIVLALLGLVDSFGGKGFTVGAGPGRSNTIPLPHDIPVFASGGSLNAGQLSVVGERGAELFVPRTAGQIISNDQLGAIGGREVIVINNHFTIQALDGESVKSILFKEEEFIQNITSKAISRSRGLKRAGL